MIEAMLAALLTMAQPGGAGSGITPQILAGALQSLVGQHMDHGTTVTRVAAEGQTVVMDFDGPVGWRAGMSPAQISALFLHNFCADRDFDYFVRGQSVRVDSTEGGAAPRTGPLITQCPTG
jgi:hypothetical protein